MKRTALQKMFGVLAVMATFTPHINADVLQVPGDFSTIDDAVFRHFDGFVVFPLSSAIPKSWTSSERFNNNSLILKYLRKYLFTYFNNSII